ncbi:hypothetical protein R5R35_012374 [Gryllus longicercus]|uniref:Uncharacterized protein n=1 Tax=Gryllus longicercus TaxID=2509291 RepID=A0AAN9VNI6_9ORTH
MSASRFRVVQEWHKWFTENVNYESAYEGFNIFIALLLFALYVYVAEIVEFVCDMYMIERPGIKRKHGKSKKMQESADTKNSHEGKEVEDDTAMHNK